MSVAVVAPRRRPRGAWSADLRHRRGPHDAVDEGRQWAAAWQRVLASAVEGGSGPPGNFEEFDRTVRAMLNRISRENACRLLPLDPCLRSTRQSGSSGDDVDSPLWWASRFAALMLATYMQAVHTNRCARALATRSADNVLPAYLDAISPLLARSPRLVDALTGWMAGLLDLHDLYWPTARLVLLAAQDHDRAELEPRSLGRLPAELLQGRIMQFLVPPALLGRSATAATRTAAGGGAAAAAPRVPSTLCGCWSSDDGRKDAVAVFAHLLLFAPAAAWPQLSAFAFSVTEAVLCRGQHHERDLFLGASVVSAVAHRLELGGARVGGEGDATRSARFSPASRSASSQVDCLALAGLHALLETRLRAVTSPKNNELVAERRPKVSAFVRSHAMAALDRAGQFLQMAQ